MSDKYEPSKWVVSVNAVACLIVALGMFKGVFWLFLPAVAIGWAAKAVDKQQQADKALLDKQEQPVLTNKKMFKRAGYSDAPVSKTWAPKNNLDKLSRL